MVTVHWQCLYVKRVPTWMPRNVVIVRFIFIFSHIKKFSWSFKELWHRFFILKVRTFSEGTIIKVGRLVHINPHSIKFNNVIKILKTFHPIPRTVRCKIINKTAFARPHISDKSSVVFRWILFRFHQTVHIDSFLEIVLSFSIILDSNSCIKNRYESNTLLMPLLYLSPKSFIRSTRSIVNCEINKVFHIRNVSPNCIKMITLCCIVVNDVN